MNILYLCDEYPPGSHGGIGTAVQLLAREMVKMGNNVVVAGFYDWGYGGEDEFDDQGVKVYRFRRMLSSGFFANYRSIIVKITNRILKDTGILEWDIKKSLIKYKKFLDSVIARYHIEIVEAPDYNDYARFCKSYLPFPVLPAPLVVKLHGSITYFAHENNKEVPHNVWQMDHDLLEQATAVSSVSKYTAIKTSDYLQYKGNIKVIYNGLDTHIPVANVKKVKNRVIFTGSLLQKKGIYQLIKAWNIVHEENKESELWIFGKGPIDELKALVSPAAVKSVYFKGHVGREMLFEELCRAGIAVFPSFAESFGLAPLEAMICGCAVIFTQSSCGPEIVQDGVTGLLADPYNINDIASKILLLLNNNTYCGQLALRGQRYVKETFDIKKIAKDNQNYYSALLQ